LKGSGISIQEDMTKDNVKLVKEAERSCCFSSVWFANDKVHAKDKKGNNYVLNLFDDFAEVIRQRGRGK
jgi:hypothetical protein